MENIKTLIVTDRIEEFTFSDLPIWIACYEWSDRLLGSKDYFDIVIIDRNVTVDEQKTLLRITRAYCLFYTDDLKMNTITEELVNRKVGEQLSLNAVEVLLKTRGKDFFAHTYGEKYYTDGLAVAQGFKGSVKWDGNYKVSVNGEYGDDYNQIVFWRSNIPFEPQQSLDFWLEYKKDDSVSIVFEIRKRVYGSLDDICNTWTFSEEELKEEICIENNDIEGTLFFSIKAKGKGTLEIIGLHSRHSRRGLGEFMVGGQRYVTSNREEIFAYFDPGDLRPPLAVYFSGYKTKEGFEGYHMLRKMGCPFLLIAEQRFEGGGFYIGDEEYEKMMVSIIDNYMNKLGFYPEQVVLSGVSMGAIGSMYYGCDVKPHALIIGKPLASLGDIAKNERINRPKGFPTSLDLLHHYGEGMDDAAVERLNERVWSKIRNTDFSHTKFIVSYMFEDDYDATAYNRLLTELNSSGVQVYGKGLHGRHNDNTAGVVAWFKGQYDRVLKEDFGR